MSFNSLETSIDDAQPVFLYTFSRTGKSWYYNSSEYDITITGITYLAAPVSVGETVSSGDTQGESFDVLLPTNTAFCAYLDSITTSAEIYVRIRKAHILIDADTGVITPPASVVDTQAYQFGLYTGVDRSAINFRKLNCSSLSQSLTREGLRLSWSRNCPHILYGLGCRVDKAPYGVTVAAGVIVDGELATATEAALQPDGYYSGGFVQWESSAGVVETRGIEKHVGINLTIFGSTHGLGGGSAYTIYPGCNRTAEDCNTKFSNILNYGGIQHMPGKSPFDGTPVY